MPPHVLLQSTDEMKGDARLKPAAFRPSNQLPKHSSGWRAPGDLGADLRQDADRSWRGRDRRHGTRRRLNGYSSGGKTGTAKKIDPVTHTYSHTKLVASFAGFAPVSSPAISIAVVIDTPTVGSGYGCGDVAPVFQVVAQQVLEYLGVPHDQPMKTSKELHAAASREFAGRCTK